MVRRAEDYRPARSDGLYELPWISEFDFGHLKSAEGALCRHIAAGKVLLRQGGTNDGIFYVDQGRVRLLVRGYLGEEKTVSIVTEGGVFGELSAFTGNHSPVEAMAITDVVVYSVPGETILRENGFLQEMFLYLIRCNLLNLSEIQSLVFDDAYTRLAACLYRLSLRYGRGNGGIVTLPIHFTHEQMAALLGVSRVTVTNLIKRMVQTGLIRSRSGFVTVLRPDELAAAGGVDPEELSQRNLLAFDKDSDLDSP